METMQESVTLVRVEHHYMPPGAAPVLLESLWTVYPDEAESTFRRCKEDAEQADPGGAQVVTYRVDRLDWKSREIVPVSHLEITYKVKEYE